MKVIAWLAVAVMFTSRLPCRASKAQADWFYDDNLPLRDGRIHTDIHQWQC